MGKELIGNKEAIEYFDIASEITNLDLQKLCLEGPADLLNRTDVCQLATLVTSIAALECLKDTNPEVRNFQTPFWHSIIYRKPSLRAEFYRFALVL